MLLSCHYYIEPSGKSVGCRTSSWPKKSNLPSDLPMTTFPGSEMRQSASFGAQLCSLKAAMLTELPFGKGRVHVGGGPLQNRAPILFLSIFNMATLWKYLQVPQT